MQKINAISLHLDKWLDKLAAKLFYYRHIVSEEMKLPDIKGRHVFTAQLRITLFLATWLIFFAFFPAVWTISPFVPLIFNVGFLLTAYCYLYVIRCNKMVFSVMALEIFADVVSQTALIYLLGLNGFAPYLIYGLYVAAVGILSGFHASLAASTLALICYNFLFILVHSGSVSAFVYPQSYVGIFDLVHVGPYLNLLFLPLSFVIIVYSVRIANHFSKIKEQALELRNTQLTALNHIGSTIRRVMNVQKVIDEVLKAVIQGLNFEVCILALIDENEKKIKFYLPEGNYYTMRLEEILGVKYADMYLPLNVRNNSASMAILRNKVLIRNNFAELTFGILPDISMQASLRAQKILGFKKFVVTPLVAELRVIGVIIGASKKSFVEDHVIDTLDHFANQAALAIESSQLIERLEQKNRELIEANKVKSEFLAIMSHELRTPLNAVIGYTEALLDDELGILNKDQKYSLQEVLRNGKNLLELINSILDLAKIESGKMEILQDKFDLHDMVNDVKSSLKPLLDKRKQILSVHRQENLPSFYADAVKFRQIIMNLIGNAIKFTHEGGEIDIFLEYHVSARELYETDFGSEKFSKAIVRHPAFLIRVRDTGVGIKEEDMPGIFELFKQVDSSFTRSHQGTGLGLALTKQLVLLHKGLITVKSTYGHGAEFKVIIPQGVLET